MVDQVSGRAADAEAALSASPTAPEVAALPGDDQPRYAACPPDHVADVLDHTANLIARPGAWMQGDYCDEFMIERASCWCIEGAVAYVTGLEPGVAEEWCDAHVAPLMGVRNVAQWNDDVCKTQGQAVAFVREAAARALRQAA